VAYLEIGQGVDIYSWPGGQAFAFEAGHFGPAEMARLACVCEGHKFPALTPNRRRHATLL